MSGRSGAAPSDERGTGTPKGPAASAPVCPRCTTHPARPGSEFCALCAREMDGELAYDADAFEIDYWARYDRRDRDWGEPRGPDITRQEWRDWAVYVKAKVTNNRTLLRRLDAQDDRKRRR